MSSLGSEHGGTWNFVGRDVVVLHRLPDSARCPAGGALAPRMDLIYDVFSSFRIDVPQRSLFLPACKGLAC